MNCLFAESGAGPPVPVISNGEILTYVVWAIVVVSIVCRAIVSWRATIVVAATTAAGICFILANHRNRQNIVGWFSADFLVVSGLFCVSAIAALQVAALLIAALLMFQRPQSPKQPDGSCGSLAAEYPQPAQSREAKFQAGSSSGSLAPDSFSLTWFGWCVLILLPLIVLELVMARRLASPVFPATGTAFAYGALVGIVLWRNGYVRLGQVILLAIPLLPLAVATHRFLRPTVHPGAVVVAYGSCILLLRWWLMRRSAVPTESTPYGMTDQKKRPQ